MEIKKYEIVGTEVRPFTYRIPIITIDENGEPSVIYSNNKDTFVHIKRITFLNIVARDSKGQVVSYEPMDYVNRFLMAHHIDDNREESAQHSKALTHFFSFLILLQEKWDAEYNEDLFDEMVDLPRPKWDSMASRKGQRIRGSGDIPSKKDKASVNPCHPWPPEAHYFSVRHTQSAIARCNIDYSSPPVTPCATGLGRL